ncbi:MAG TPA: HNH endonuclease [bacterium]|nr:HNH endonuclease [bacterium]
MELKSDRCFRKALWQAYNKTDALTGELIPSHEYLSIDHIIPIEKAKKPQKLKQLFRELGLPEDFDINSYENLIPTIQRHNRQKYNHLFSERGMLYYLELARKNIPEVKRKEAQYRQELKKSSSIKNWPTYRKFYFKMAIYGPILTLMVVCYTLYLFNIITFNENKQILLGIVYISGSIGFLIMNFQLKATKRINTISFGMISVFLIAFLLGNVVYLYLKF